MSFIKETKKLIIDSNLQLFLKSKFTTNCTVKINEDGTDYNILYELLDDELYNLYLQVEIESHEISSSEHSFTFNISYVSKNPFDSKLEYILESVNKLKIHKYKAIFCELEKMVDLLIESLLDNAEKNEPLKAILFFNFISSKNEEIEKMNYNEILDIAEKTNHFFSFYNQSKQFSGCNEISFDKKMNEYINKHEIMPNLPSNLSFEDILKLGQVDHNPMNNSKDFEKKIAIPIPINISNSGLKDILDDFLSDFFSNIKEKAKKEKLVKQLKLRKEIDVFLKENQIEYFKNKIDEALDNNNKEDFILYSSYLNELNK